MYAELKLRWDDLRVRLLVGKSYLTEKVIFSQKVAKKEDVEISPQDQAKIEAAWQETLKRNPRAFPGGTMRLRDNCLISTAEKLCLEVLPSDYKQAMVLGWLGVAMVLVTSDGYVALQAPVATIAATVGGGIRTPGCTPPHVRFFCHIVKEMQEEFNVTVGLSQLKVLGLVEVSPPAAKYHHGLIVHVSLKETFDELKAKWATAEDRWEGEILPFRLTPENVVRAMFFEKEKYNPVTPLVLHLVAKDQFGDFGVEVY